MSSNQIELIASLTRVLCNEVLTLVPLAKGHRLGLSKAGSSPAIWTLQPFNIADGFDAYFDWLLAEHAAGRWIVFVIMDRNGVIVGQTCYLDLQANYSGLEIGGTWYTPEVQGTNINPAAKLLMLDNAFAAGMVRVQFKTDSANTRSRSAITKLGATFEGTFRKHRKRPDGTWRDTVYYSILDDEWPRLRTDLVERIETFAIK